MPGLGATFHDRIGHRCLVRSRRFLLLSGAHKGRRELVVADLVVSVLIEQQDDFVQLFCRELHIEALQRLP